ncbi:hypothetical protein [Parafrankia sp. FMc2]|uniref:hypothetical protein n=1 Tax=Parafrankia sp. FMc2 TaxID=3233196 RepID=UPI0034D7A9B6
MTASQIATEAAWDGEAVMYRRRVEIPGGYDIGTHRAAWLLISGHREADGVCDLDGESWPCSTFTAAPEWVRVLAAHGIYPSDLQMGIVVSAGDAEVALTCTGCGRFAQPVRHRGCWQSGLTPCEGDLFCWPCTEAYLNERINPRVRDSAGRDTGYRELDYTTATGSESSLSEPDRQTVRAGRRRGRRGSRSVA